MRLDLVFHITTAESWRKQMEAITYRTESLTSEGFIHCSTGEQVAGTLERYYADQKGLILLHINLSLLNPELKFEKSTNGEIFPHVFGEINKSAIIKVEKLK